MSHKEYTAHQQRIIKNYYKNRISLALQKLEELVPELYLAASEKQRDQLWKRVEKAMAPFDISAALRGHILGRRSVEVLAENLKNWLASPPKEVSAKPAEPGGEATRPGEEDGNQK